MKDRCVCIHGHFYQPPRENPWLEAVELQGSAHPFHDWNERVTAECYAPNAAARILADGHHVLDIVNNYSRISFDFGPTLLSWLQEYAGETYRAILEADRESRRRFSGHGSALAQGYSHMILPLANRRDKRTQVLWGIRDFEHRFGRPPEGMWLPEAAVDLETLEILAEHGVAFTLLAPRQARRVRELKGGEWRELSVPEIDPKRPYLCRLPGGRTIHLFFYDGPVSRAVAFDRILDSGEAFAARLRSVFSDEPGPQLVHIATDGESYGHHHRFGEMALAYALRRIEKSRRVRLTNYGEFLENHPPSQEVEIAENTSWSCNHGVERWRNDCGCTTGAHPGWNQAWRAPLRKALDWLRDQLAPRFERHAAGFLKKPWEARDDYIEVVLDRSDRSLDRFLEKHALRPLEHEERVETLKSLEMQRHAMLMFTSCGWFFDDLSGIETIQNLEYACRAVDLARDLLEEDLEPDFLDRLQAARSNLSESGSGRRIWTDHVRPAVVDLRRAGAHDGVRLLFDKAPARTWHAFRMEGDHLRVRIPDGARLAIGRTRVVSRITREESRLEFVAFHRGGKELCCGVREFETDERHESLAGEIEGAFSRGDAAELVRRVKRSFAGGIFNLDSLLMDERSALLEHILLSSTEEAADACRRIFERHASLARALTRLGAPVPPSFRPAAVLAMGEAVRRALEADLPDHGHVRGLIEQARDVGVAIDERELSDAYRQALERLASKLGAEPADATVAEALRGLLELARETSPRVDLWRVQNLFYAAARRACPVWRRRRSKDPSARDCLERFAGLAAALDLRLPGAPATR